jgi:hypothetical protein
VSRGNKRLKRFLDGLFNLTLPLSAHSKSSSSSLSSARMRRRQRLSHARILAQGHSKEVKGNEEDRDGGATSGNPYFSNLGNLVINYAR